MSDKQHLPPVNDDPRDAGDDDPRDARDAPVLRLPADPFDLTGEPPHRLSTRSRSFALFIPLACAALLWCAMRLWRLTDSCLWFDEIFSLHAARHPWSEILHFVAADIIHPPLFYLLLKVWATLGGESLLWLRLFPALVAIASLLPFLLLMRELRLSFGEAALVVLLGALNGFLIKYAQEVRMYSLLLFFTLTSLWLFVRYFDARRRAERRTLWALFAVNLLLVYTHYFGWLVVVTQCLFLLLFGRKGAGRKRSFALSALALLVCFMPWVWMVVGAASATKGLAQNIGWMTRPTTRSLAQFFVTLNELFYYQQSSAEPLFFRLSAPLYALVFGLPILLLVFGRMRRKNSAGQLNGGDAGQSNGDNVWLWWLGLFCLLPLILAFLASYLLPYSVWGTRHLIIVSAPYLLLAGIALMRLRPLWLKVSLVGLLACWALLAATVVALRPAPAYIWCTWEAIAQRVAGEASDERRHVDERQKVDERQRVDEKQQLGESRQVDERRKVYAFEDLVAYHLWFALSSRGEQRVSVEVVKGIEGLTEDPAYFLPRAFDEVKTTSAAEAFREERFWIAFRDTDLKPDAQPLRLLAERGLELEESFEIQASGMRAYLVRFGRRRAEAHAGASPSTAGRLTLACAVCD